jgi:FeS assembly SUF system protein
LRSKNASIPQVIDPKIVAGSRKQAAGRREAKEASMFGFKKNQDKEQLKTTIIAALKGVYDPEIPVNIYDLGLIYDVLIDDENHVDVKMTLTTPGCPVAQTFPGTVEQAVNQVEGVKDCTVELVWEPPWTQERMTEAARLELGIFY